MTEETANAAGPSEGRRVPRGPETFRTVLVYPTRDGDHILVTLNLGKYNLCIISQEITVNIEYCGCLRVLRTFYKILILARESSTGSAQEPAEPPRRRVRFAPDFSGSLLGFYGNPLGF